MSMRKQNNAKLNLIGGFNSSDNEHLQRDKSNSYQRDNPRDNPRDSQRQSYTAPDDFASSPSAWIYKGGMTLQDLCRPFMGAKKSVKSTKDDFGRPGKDAAVASWRQMAAKTILSSERNSDDDNGRGYDNRNQQEDPSHPLYHQRQDSIREITGGSLKAGSYHEHQDLVPDEPRIIAPNVSKLSPRSVVEIRLQSANECVAILCSVDVLKMRSVFFYEVLNEQEENRNQIASDQNDIWRDPLVIPESSPFEAAAFLESLHEGRSLLRGDWAYCWARLSVAWQVQELILEYAAQIDSHFGHILLSIRNNNWRTNPNIWVGARVAVFRKGATMMPTVVTGVVIEAAPTTGYSKIRVLFDSSDSRGNAQRVSSVVGNPSARGDGRLEGGGGGLVGGSTPLHSPTGNAPPLHSTSIFREGNREGHMAFTPRMPSSPRATLSLSTPAKTHSSNAMNAMTGDVGEPMWIQLSHPAGNPVVNILSGSGSFPYHTQSHGSNNIPNTPHNPHHNMSNIGLDFSRDNSPNTALNYSSWLDPDEASMVDTKKLITSTDKRIFWEMAKAIIELPEISEFCNSSIKNAKDLAALLKKPEFKILWTAEAADILPKHAASELVTAAYAQSSDK